MTFASANPALDPTRRRAALDLSFALAVFLLFSAALPWLDAALRRGHGLAGVTVLAAYQFACEGLAVAVLLVWRRERPADYGFTRTHLARSLLLGLTLAILYNLGVSWHAGTLLWLPFAHHSAMRMALSGELPAAVLGIAIMVTTWGYTEAFFGVFFARKVNILLRHAGRGWLSPGALGFALFNGLIHFALGQGLSGFTTCFASGYAIAVIPAVTGNAWGSGLVQALTNAIGHP